MAIEIKDKSLMMMMLLEKCNFSCIHCAREDGPMEVGYKLSFEQFRRCLSDCHHLELIEWVHFTGGEPTLWKEGKRNLIDLLIEISNSGFTPGFTSNGSSFNDYKRCCEFFARYYENAKTPIKLYLSIDTFHHNFDPKQGRAKCLDNVLKFRQEFLSERMDLLKISIIVVISRDFESLLPDEMVEYYESQGVSFGFIPMYRYGKANELKHLCPDVDSDNPEDMGAYQRYHQMNAGEKSDKIDEQERADFLNLIGDTYYFARPWREVGQLRHLPEAIIQAYSKNAGD